MKRILLSIAMLILMVSPVKAIVVDSNYNVSVDYTTTDGTEVQRANLQPDADSTTVYEAEAIAISSTGVSAYWHVVRVAKRNGTDDPTMIGSLTNIITPIKDLGAATWTFNLNAIDDYVAPVIKGANGVTINWYISIKVRGLHKP